MEFDHRRAVLLERLDQRLLDLDDAVERRIRVCGELDEQRVLGGCSAHITAILRRVDLPIATALRFAVWPGLWPAMVVAVTLQGVKLLSPGTLLAVVGEAALAALLYFALFALAIGRRDRSEYIAKAMAIMGRGTRLVPVS